MFERFTKRARNVVAMARLEAAALGHSYSSTEHLLLGLLRDPEGVAGRVLRDHGVSYDETRDSILTRVGSGPGRDGGRDAEALASIGIDLDSVLASVEGAFGAGALDRSRPHSRIGEPKFASDAKRVLELALREALTLGHNYIGTEHLLIAIVRQGEGMAYEVLEQLSPPASNLREATLARLAELRKGA